MSKLLECFVCLLSRLRDTPENVSAYELVCEEYKPVLLSSNDEGKATLSKKIERSVVPVYEQYRKEILNRDFSFLKQGVLVVGEIDVGYLYRNTLRSDNDTVLKKVTSELLFLFHCVMNEEDKILVETKFKKPKKEKKSRTEAAVDMEHMLSKNKDSLKKLEKDPNAIGDVMGDILKNNSADLSKIATGLLSGMGLDPSKLAKQAKKPKKV